MLGAIQRFTMELSMSLIPIKFIAIKFIFRVINEKGE